MNTRLNNHVFSEFAYLVKGKMLYNIASIDCLGGIY